MIPFDDEGNDLLDTNETTPTAHWRCFWWAWAYGEVQAPDRGAIIRRQARAAIADLSLCSMGIKPPAI